MSSQVFELSPANPRHWGLAAQVTARIHQFALRYGSSVPEVLCADWLTSFTAPIQIGGVPMMRCWVATEPGDDGELIVMHTLVERGVEHGMPFLVVSQYQADKGYSHTAEDLETFRADIELWCAEIGAREVRAIAFHDEHASAARARLFGRLLGLKDTGRRLLVREIGG